MRLAKGPILTSTPFPCQGPVQTLPKHVNAFTLPDVPGLDEDDEEGVDDESPTMARIHKRKLPGTSRLSMVTGNDFITDNDHSGIAAAFGSGSESSSESSSNSSNDSESQDEDSDEDELSDAARPTGDSDIDDPANSPNPKVMTAKKKRRVQGPEVSGTV